MLWIYGKQHLLYWTTRLTFSYLRYWTLNNATRYLTPLWTQNKQLGPLSTSTQVQLKLSHRTQ